MILIFNRGLDKKLVQLKMKEDQKEFLVKKTGKPKRIKLPWFIFDMHTAKGKWAWNIFMKRNHGTKIDKDNIKFLWFHLESGTIPLDKINYKMKIEDKPLPTDTIWWQQLMREIIL
jgi:hypothetical protein